MVFVALIASGCALIFFKDHTYAAKERWEIRTPPPHLFEAIAETGRSMGFAIDYWEMRNPPVGQEYWETKSPPPVDANDLRSRSILLSDNELGGLKAVLLGKHHVSGLTFYAWHGGNYMEVYVTVAGNLGSGEQKAAMNWLEDFRTNLSRKIGEIIVLPEAPPALAPAA
jgi:hypothetical protein